jgi:hypothetical protein
MIFHCTESFHGLQCLPDLSACDYFPWQYLHAKKYATISWIINDLKTAIRKQIPVIPKKHGEVSTGKPASKVGRVYTQSSATT